MIDGGGVWICVEIVKMDGNWVGWWCGMGYGEEGIMFLYGKRYY